MKKTIIGFRIFLIMIPLVFTNCTKDDLRINQEKILGIWISIDKSDTLDFTTENDFYKSNGYMTDDHFDYELSNDSIEIGYKGHLMILVTPTKHKYSIEDKNMTIDFSNKQCYGFSTVEMTYKKEN